MGCGECRDCSGARSYGPFSNDGRRSHAPTTVCGTADGTRRSTVGTLNMGTWAGTGEALAWDIASDVPSTSPSHGSNSGAHGESCSTHTYAFNPFRTRTQNGRTHMVGRRRLLFLTTCSDDSKPYMILVALIKGFQNHIGFAIIRASGEECTGRRGNWDHQKPHGSYDPCGPERVKRGPIGGLRSVDRPPPAQIPTGLPDFTRLHQPSKDYRA